MSHTIAVEMLKSQAIFVCFHLTSALCQGIMYTITSVEMFTNIAKHVKDYLLRIMLAHYSLDQNVVCQLEEIGEIGQKW